MASTQEEAQQQTDNPIGPVRRPRRRSRQVENGRRTGRQNRTDVCTQEANTVVETIEVVEEANGPADISCIDITEDDDVICIGSSENSEVLTLRTVNRRVGQSRAPVFNNQQYPPLIGSGTVVNGFGPPLYPMPQPVSPVERIVGKVIKCSVCLEDITAIEKSGKRLISTNCGHVFCESCIKECMRNTKACPTCRKKLTAKQYHPIFL